MDIDEIEFKDPPEFVKYVCGRLNMTKEEFRDEFREACVNGHFDSPVFSTVRKLFRFHCFCSSRFRTKNKMLCTTKLFEYLISGNLGFDNLRRKLKEYDYSARCSLVWTTNYFAYRCRTCGMSPSMSLCSSCFTAGNHEGHDFNKFKSHAGGACDCGDATVMKESGFCRFHGLDKVHNRPVPPDDLVAPLRCLLPSFLSALLYWLWEHGRDSDGLNFNEDDTPAISILHALHASGWVTQKMIADVMIDKAVYEKLIYETESRRACGDYQLSVSSNPEFEFPPIISNQNLVHQTLLDAFIFSTIKLRFPESLVTFLIGLLAVEEFKEEFIQSYLNHYTRIASTVLLSARARISPEWSLQMNNRIVHISVQLFSGEELALRVIKQRNLHHLLVHCLLNMLTCCRTRLDDRSNMVLSCDGILIQNNVFWPFVSDLSNLVSHKSIVDILVEDADFLSAWTKLIRYMQFMNCFTMKEGNHIEYETMTFYHAFTMEVEISSATMWNFWKHCRLPSERTHCLLYTKACLSTLADLLNGLGRLISPTVPETRPTRSALSLHLPLMRHVSCFLHLSTMQHGVNIRQLLVDYLLPKPRLLRRFMEHLVNILLGCHEVLIGYWIRNGQSVRQSVSHYMQSQFCYSFIDLDIFALQVCTALLPPAYFLNALVDQTKLLRGICFHDELLSLVSEPEVKNLDRKPIALQAWLTNLCFVLDLRNNLGLTEEELLQKELVSVLAPEPRKRSDLSILIPERCGIINPSNNLDSVLRKVATYSAPSCDETSGSLISGHYYLRPSLWHTDFDPIFHLLRVTSRRESSLAMEKYREHCRQRHGVTNMSSLWPPFHKPKQLPPDFRGLDHVLHSRHLHYIIFIQLSLFVYGDPLVTEESLAMIIHLIDRALDTPCRLPGNNRKTCTKIFMESQASKSSESNLPTSSLNNVNNYETGTKNLIEQKQTEEMDEIQQQQPLKPKDLIAEKSQNAFVDDFIMDWEKGRFEEVLEDTDSDRLDQIDYDDDDDDDEYGDDDVVDDDDNNSNETVAGVGSSDDRDLNELTIDSQRINNKQLRTKTRNYRSSHIWRRQPWSSLCPLPSTPSFSSSSNTTTATNPSPTNNRQKKFWDTSLINCPYQSRTSIQDNLNCWLMISNHNIPQVSCAQVMLASLPMNQGSDLNCTLSTVPVLSNNEIQNDSKNIMLDSIISLLIKAHARLYWSRIVGGADAIPKISFGGSLFTDPNLTAQQSGITDSSMSVTTTMPAVNVDGNNPIILGQDQVDGSWQDFLDVFPKHNTVVSNATTTTNNNCLTPRCMAVLMPNERHECSNLNNSSSPTASSSFASNNVNLNTSIIASLPPELRYFASSKPTYFLPEERNESTYRQESINAKKSYNFTSSLANNDDNSLTTTNDVCHFTNFGDGAYWIERLLDKIASLSENNKSAIKMYLARARSPYKQVIHLHTLQPMDVISSSSSSSNVVQQCQQKQQLTVSHNSNTMNSSKEVIGLNNETDVIFNIPFSSTNDGNNSSMNQNSSCLLTTSAVGTRDERKRAAQERRKRLIEQMTSKQKAFASTHLKDIESLNRQTVDRKEQLDNSEPLYECVICQISGRPSVDDMVLLDMICESNLMLQLRETAVIPTLYGRDLSHSSGYPPVLSETDDLSWLSPERPPVSGPLFQNSPLSNSTNSDNPSPVSGSSQAPAGIVGLPIHPITTNSSIKSHTERSSSPKPETLSGNKQSKHHSCYTEHRQWWSNAIPSLISKTLPLLHSGILLQTCGHVVHRECFQRYRTHGGNRSAATRHRSWIVCPLCRRDIHHLLPLVPLPKSGTFGNKQQLFPSVEYGQQNIAMLLSRLNSLSDTGSTFWNDLNCSEDELNVQRRILMSQLIGSNYEATILLRCQLECELSVLMSYPSQYSMVSRRCYWREFICYLRQIYKKSSDIKNLIQCLMIDEVIRSDNNDDNMFPVFALLQDPADILLGLLPHIWPHEGIFHTVLASTFCLAYIRALISVTFNRSTSSTCFNLVKQINRTKYLLGKISGVLRKHLENLLNYLSELNTSFTPSTSDDDNHHLNDTQRDQQCHSTESLEDTCPSSNKIEHILKVLYLASKLPDENFFNQSSPSSSPSTAASSSSLSSITATTPPSLPVEYDQNQIELHIILRVLPFLRIASLCWTRWHPDNVGTVKPLGLPFVGLLNKTTQKTNSHDQLSTKEFVSITPEQQLIEFSDLCRILSLDCGDSTVINVAQVGELAGRLCGLCSPNNNNAIECLIGRWIGQIKKVSSVHLTASSPTLLLSSSSPVCDVSSHINDNNNDVNQLSNIDHRNILTEVENVSSVSRGTPYVILHIAEYLRSLVEIGRQLCSPRLIRTPSSFDVLFNALHLVNCSSNQHRFQDNILCLICGRLLCSLCSNLATVVVEHTYMCGGFSGVVLEVNTSIVYVSLGSNICDWGSVYLDEYGEEDLELKRGKPLFLNAERFALLENQWITHSFRHVLKNWRSV
uniref:E3 ubiquitin-protein ligase n=1 Tax=Schistosoma mansoni TaxID=6183 RepID=A0A5K4F7R9_SCHMA